MENASPKFPPAGAKAPALNVYSVSEVAEILRGLLEDSLPSLRSISIAAPARSSFPLS
jgi:hypothetical protein